MAVMKVGAAGIETISGAMKKPKKLDGHNHGNYLVATHRTAATTTQKNHPGGKSTINAYLWSLEMATYDQAYPRG